MQGTPSKSQLLGWRQDPVTIWVMKNLRQKFPYNKTVVLQESLNRVNHRAGQESVMEALDKIYDYIPEDSA